MMILHINLTCFNILIIIIKQLELNGNKLKQLLIIVITDAAGQGADGLFINSETLNTFEDYYNIIKN